MDLLSEATSGGGRVLAARHITADQAVPEVNNAVNTSLVCHSMDFMPDFKSYMTALHMYGPVLWTLAGAASLCTLLVYGLSLRAAYRRRSTFAHAAVILAVYPVVALSALVSLIVPRARLIGEAVAQEAVMVAMYHLFQLLVAECGGAEQLVRCAEGARLETRVLPCCCWPCCVLPRPLLHKSRISTLRYLVLQMPIIQAILYVVILVLWAEDKNLYANSFIMIQPFIAASILLGVWAMIMTVRAAEAAGARPRGKFLAVQIVLLVVKLQGGAVKVVPALVKMPCLMALHPSVFINLIHNSLMLVEVFLLSVWAWYLYSAKTDKFADKFADKVQHAVVAVLEESPKANSRKLDFTQRGSRPNSFGSEVK